MLDPGPALADAVQDDLNSGVVGDVGARQMNHQQPLVAIDCDVPIAPDALTANVMADQRQSYIEAGMNGVVAKPIDAAELLIAMEAALAEAAPGGSGS